MQYEGGKRPSAPRRLKQRSGNPAPIPATTIVGYSADPTQKENWENDFGGLDELSDPVSGRFAPWRPSVASLAPAANAVDHDSKSDSDDGVLSPSGSSSSEGDWDNAFQDDDDGAASSTMDSDAMSATMQKQVSSLLRSYLAASDPLAPQSKQPRTPHHAHSVPKRYQLLRQLQAEDGSPGVKIVVYPKPSTLYSEHTEEGRVSFRESVLEEWLSMLGLKPAPAYLSLPAPQSTSIGELPVPSTLPTLSDWLSRTLQHMHSFYRHHSSSWAIERCWDICTETINALGRSKFVLSDSIPESASRPVFDRLYLILYAAAKTYPRHHIDTYSTMIATSVAAFPRYKGHLELLLLASIAHTDATRLNRVLRNYMVVFNAHDAAETSLQIEVAADALASLHLYLNQYSPLNTAVLGATWDIADDPNVQWLEFALNDCEITPDLLNVPAMSPAQLKQEARLWNFCGSAAVRLERLEALYAKLEGATMLRAKCAYVIGHFALHEHHNTALAERLLFECIYLLDRAKPVLQSLVPLVSELGTNALIAYGDILLYNGKYKYAVLAMEASSSIYKLRKGVDFSAMDRRLCDVCSDNRDWERSLRFHQRILSVSKTQENVAEFVYLSQQISKIYAEVGDFANAEKNLIDALSFLSQMSHRSTSAPSPNSSLGPIPADRDIKSDETGIRSREFGTIGRYMTRSPYGNASLHRSGSRSVGRRSKINLLTFSQSAPFEEVTSAGSSNSDPTVSMTNATSSSAPVAVPSLGRNRAARLGLYLRLGQLYRSAGRFSDSVSAFQTILDHDLARSRTSFVKLLLARAALKRGAYTQVNSILDELESSSSLQLPENPSPLRARLNVPQMMPFSVSEDVASTPEFLEVRILSLMHQERYEPALSTAVNAISTCPPSNLMQLARLHSLRARTLLGMDSRKLQDLTLPRDSPSKIDLHLLHWGLPNLNACIQAYSVAFEYYSKVNDIYHAGKMLSGIAQSYLDVLVLVFVILRWPVDCLRPWLESNGFDMKSGDFLSRVEIPATHALDTFADCFDLLHFASALLSIAEIRAVQAFCRDDPELILVSMSYWKEVRDAFFALLVSEYDIPTLSAASPGYRNRVARLISRMVRLLVTFDPDFVAANSYVLDVFLVHQNRFSSEDSTATHPIPQKSAATGSAMSNSDKTRSNRLIRAGKRFTLALRRNRSRNHTLTPQQSQNTSPADSETELVPISPKFTSTEPDCSTHLVHIHRNCLLFASSKLLQNEVHEKNKGYIRRLKSLMDKRSGLGSGSDSSTLRTWASLPKPSTPSPLGPKSIYVITISSMIALFTSTPLPSVITGICSRANRDKVLIKSMVRSLYSAPLSRDMDDPISLDSIVVDVESAMLDALRNII